LRTLLIDNYDSFAYNLFQLLAEENGVEPIVVRNDEASWEELACLEFDNVVLSPGPGRPERRRDFGVCADAIRHSEVPLLGVCLGHQGLGWVHGGRVARAPEPLHGRLRAVEHAGSPLFAGIPRRFEAARYHSLCLEAPLPPELEAIAWADDGVTMAVAHRTRPQWGVQFHPESIATEHGRRLLANFRDLTPTGTSSLGNDDFLAHTATKSSSDPAASGLELRTRTLDALYDPARAFIALYGKSPNAFWLDSSRPGRDARFSFMGDASGPLGATISYDVEACEVTVERGGETEALAEPFLDYLERELRRLGPLATDLPFAFDCGFAGYLGYELKADCGAARGHRSELPDAAFVFADRMVAFDHEQGRTYLLCLVDGGGEEAAGAWLDAAAATLAELPPRPELPPLRPTTPVEFRLARSPDRYLADIAVCEEHLLDGDSYEICLTNSVEAEVAFDPLELYLELRRVNPAPFASYLRFGDLAVLSSSPERFLRVDREGLVEARPIKGTSRRGDSAAEDTRLAEELRTSEKDRAENLMIVDLMRNDLGAVCEVASIEVPALMEVESYESVHQLVSTVRGRLRRGGSAIDCVRSCFPPGSMTGAPKLRTMEILDRLEGRARGVYSGAIGYFGLGGGCDLSVTIRTIVLDGSAATIGAGGAIVLQSDAQKELEEALLKGRAPMSAIDPVAAAVSFPAWEPKFSRGSFSEKT
jgi:para-aminobenzoate synthetase